MYKNKILLLLVFMTVSFVANSAVIPLDFGTLSPGDHAEVTASSLPLGVNNVEIDFEITGAPSAGLNAVGGTFSFNGPNGSVTINGATLRNRVTDILVAGINFGPGFFGTSAVSHFDLDLMNGEYYIDLLIDVNGGSNAAIQGQIDVAAVPLPAGIWLFGSAVIGMFGYKRRVT